MNAAVIFQCFMIFTKNVLPLPLALNTSVVTRVTIVTASLRWLDRLQDPAAWLTLSRQCKLAKGATVLKCP